MLKDFVPEHKSGTTKRKTGHKNEKKMVRKIKAVEKWRTGNKGKEKLKKTRVYLAYQSETFQPGQAVNVSCQQ